MPKRVIMNLFENQNEIQQEQISPSVLIEELAKDRSSHSKEPIECNFYELADNVPDPKELSPKHKIWWYLMTSCFRYKTSVKPITFVEGIQLVIVCIEVKIISNCFVKQFEKMQISFVCFLKTKRILVTYSTTTCPKTWRKNSLKNFSNTCGRSHTILLWLIWPRQRTMGNTDQGLTTFIS